VWGYDFDPGSNTLEVYIGYLRRKTEEHGGPRLIHTIRGVGYVLRPAPPAETGGSGDPGGADGTGGTNRTGGDGR
jgi:two-component system response regulator MprA